MAERIKVELNSEGVRQLLKSQEMMDVCASLADRAAGTLGEGYETSTYVGTNRVNVSITAATYKARRDNLQNNSLLKAIGSL